MSLFSKRLMKWREPKVKGMVTAKNVLTAAILALIFSVPFGFLGGNGKFSISVWLLGLAVMSMAPLGLALQPLEPGTLVQLTEEMIVHGPRGTDSHRSAYTDIERIYYMRHCAPTMGQDGLVYEIKKGDTSGRLCTVFEVVNRKENFYSVRRFVVPEQVNVEQVLQILRDKHVRVEEAPLDETDS